VKVFNVAKFIRMHEVEGGSADELMRLVTKQFADGLCEKNPAGILCKVDDTDERNARGRRVHGVRDCADLRRDRF
jgi:hypothetical protein